jgi:hypothetical protein
MEVAGATWPATSTVQASRQSRQREATPLRVHGPHGPSSLPGEGVSAWLHARNVDCPIDGPIRQILEAWPSGADQHRPTCARECAGASRNLERQAQVPRNSVGSGHGDVLRARRPYQCQYCPAVTSLTTPVRRSPRGCPAPPGAWRARSRGRHAARPGPGRAPRGCRCHPSP